MLFSPQFLLSNPAAVGSAPPWCTALDNLELAVLMQPPPWSAPIGLRVAEIEKRLDLMSRELPLGPLYFQRVSRAATDLEKIGVLEGHGDARNRRYKLTPAGFANLVLNQHAAIADPTFDGSEFELKREIAAINSFAMAALDLPSFDAKSLGGDAAEFFETAEALTVLGQRVLTPELVASAFSVHAVVERQIEHVGGLRAQALSSLALYEQLRAQNVGITPEAIVASMSTATGESMVAGPGMLQVLGSLVSSGLQSTKLRAAVLRYDAYLAYLQSIQELFAREAPELRGLPVVKAPAQLERGTAKPSTRAPRASDSVRRKKAKAK